VRPVLEVEVKNTTYLSSSKSTTTLNERTPLIKSGVRPDIRRTNDDVDRQSVAGLGRLVEVGLPLIM
jgi:putative membrane protein